MTGTPDTDGIEAVLFGPKMAALSEKRRALVCALFDDDTPAKGDGLLFLPRAAPATVRRPARQNPLASLPAASFTMTTCKRRSKNTRTVSCARYRRRQSAH